MREQQTQQTVVNYFVDRIGMPLLQKQSSPRSALIDNSHMALEPSKVVMRLLEIAKCISLYYSNLILLTTSLNGVLVPFILSQIT